MLSTQLSIYLSYLSNYPSITVIHLSLSLWYSHSYNVIPYRDAINLSIYHIYLSYNVYEYLSYLSFMYIYNIYHIYLSIISINSSMLYLSYPSYSSIISVYHVHLSYLLIIFIYQSIIFIYLSIISIHYNNLSYLTIIHIYLSTIHIYLLVVRSVTVAKSAGYFIRGFYHRSTWQNMWEAVTVEQTQLLNGKKKVGSS